mmetsp:Transcript_3815/g.3704  ORF Transcript_3815/g.3704 Transcript_3815/m.3704 type:complete len:208 (-) Transcript_3815:36-659(-)
MSDVISVSNVTISNPNFAALETLKPTIFVKVINFLFFNSVNSFLSSNVPVSLIVFNWLTAVSSGNLSTLDTNLSSFFAIHPFLNALPWPNFPTCPNLALTSEIFNPSSDFITSSNNLISCDPASRNSSASLVKIHLSVSIFLKLIISFAQSDVKFEWSVLASIFANSGTSKVLSIPSWSLTDFNICNCKSDIFTDSYIYPACALNVL